MPEQPVRDEEQLDRQLAELEENPSLPVDSTVRQLHAELETLADSLKDSVPPDPHERESACRHAVEQAKALAQELTAGHSQPAADTRGSTPDRLDHFRVLKLLGQGGMGAVYLAEDTRLGRQVALKTLRAELAAKPAARERFLREARLAAAVEHDHIVPIYHVGESAGIPYLAMPVLKGQSLEELLKRRSKLSLAQVIRLARQIAEGLAAAHERGLIHRDIKPANIWIEPTAGGRVKILDFGLARSAGDEAHLTASGAIVGTPAYMAPEQAKGEKVDARVDLYSLGVVLYRAATGRLPLSGNDTMSQLMALATETPRPAREVNPDVPKPLSDLIMQLLAKDRADRPASAPEVIAALAEVEKSVQLPKAADLASPGISQAAPGSQPTVALPSAVSARRSRSRLGWPVAAAVLLALLPLGYFFGGTVIRFATNQGELIVEVDDPGVEIKIVQNGVVVQDKTSKREFTLTAGKGQIEVLEKDGVGPLATKQFALNRGGKTTVRVTFQELADARKPKPSSPTGRGDGGEGDPDRRAAEYVLSIGGRVQVNEPGNDITAVADLPKEPFRLTFVNLDKNQKVTDAGLVHFKDCKNLNYLNLGFTQVTDAGLVHFKDCKNLVHLYLYQTQVSDAGLTHFKDCTSLTSLNLQSTRVTDAGLAHFKDCKNLKDLSVGETRVTDAGLVHFKDCKNLTNLVLYITQVTDAGLAHFKDCKNLTYLVLYITQVTDAGLAHFRDCKNLTYLDLSITQVTDAGLAHFKDCKNLTHLGLQGTRVTDAGLAYFKDCKNLTYLTLNYTRVSDAALETFLEFPRLQQLPLSFTRLSRDGFEQLQAVLPKCQIAWSEPNRLAAEQVLALGGAVEIGAPGQEARAVQPNEPLPRKFFQIRRLALKDCKQPLGELPATLAQLKFPELDRLEAVDFTGTPLADFGFLATVHGLKDVVLARTGLGDDDLARLPKLPQLQKLTLDGNALRGPGLRGLAEQPRLKELSLGCPSLVNAGARHLVGLKGLTRLSLVKSGITDAGLKHLEGLANLTELDLSGTQVTAAGVVALQKALPTCKIKREAADK